MNKDIIEGSWAELKGKIKAKWGKLTDHDLDTINGDIERVIGKIQKKYGYARDRAKDELKDFQKSLKNKEKELN